MYYNGNDLGLTLEDTSIKEINDHTEIKKAQKGTKPIDKYRTGTVWEVKAKFTDFNSVLMGCNGSITYSGDKTSAKFSAALYQSLVAAAKELKIVRLESNLQDTVDPSGIMTFYKAIAIFNEMDLSFSPSKQRAIEVTFECYANALGDFGFYGNASSLGISA
jgi:hypothetical protein